MVVSDSDFELLPPVLILGWPFRVVFPARVSALPHQTCLDGQPYFKISLSFTILLISSTTRELTNTTIDHACQSAVVLSLGDETAGRTLFPNQAVVSVVGVVGIAGGSAAAVANNAEVELFITQHD